MGAARSWRLSHPCLPVAQISREVIHRKSRGLLVAPVIGNGKNHILVSCNLLRECAPLDVAHDAPLTTLFDTRESSPCNQWRGRRPRITSLSSHQVGKI